jgi:hypothetical protein
MLEQEFYSRLYDNNNIQPLKGAGYIYYNNIINNRIDALIDIFPAVTACLGDDYIRYIAKDYCQKNDAKDGNLNLYGQNWGIYLLSLEACKPYEFIKDLADFEYRTQILLYEKESLFLSPTQFVQEIQNNQSVYLSQQTFVFSTIYPVFEISNFCLGKTQKQPNINSKKQCFQHYFLYRDVHNLKVFVKKISNSVTQIMPILRTKGILSLTDEHLQDKEINVFIDFLIKKQLWIK